MEKQFEIRIIVRRRPDGSAELSTYDPVHERENRTGLVVSRDLVDENIRRLKQTLERAGNRVGVREFTA